MPSLGCLLVNIWIFQECNMTPKIHIAAIIVLVILGSSQDDKICVIENNKENTH